MALRSVVSMLILRPRSVSRNILQFTRIVICDYPTLARCCPVDSSCKLPIVTYKTNASPKNGFDESKAKIVLRLNFQSPQDAIPFYKLPIKTLLHIYKTTKNDEAKAFCMNRLYYISSRIKVPPSVLSEKLAKRTFVYSLSFDWIEKSLDALLELGVSGDRILRDLWVLKYHHETIRERLQAVKNMGIENLYPWMVRCSEDILKSFTGLTPTTRNSHYNSCITVDIGATDEASRLLDVFLCTSQFWSGKEKSSLTAPLVHIGWISQKEVSPCFVLPNNKN